MQFLINYIHIKNNLVCSRTVNNLRGRARSGHSGGSV